MMENLHIRDARPSDAPFLAECIMAGMHFWDFDDIMNDDLSDILDGITECETRTDTLYTHARTRVAEVDGAPLPEAAQLGQCEGAAAAEGVQQPDVGFEIVLCHI